MFSSCHILFLTLSTIVRLYLLSCTDARNNNNLCALHLACEGGHTDFVRFLVEEAKCDVSELTINGYVIPKVFKQF